MSNIMKNYTVLSDGILFSKEVYDNKNYYNEEISDDLTKSFHNFKKVPSEENLKKLLESSNNFLNNSQNN